MIVGFTGTRVGMTTAQRKVIHKILSEDVREAHHGDCVGSDEEFHELCVDLDMQDIDITIVIHPPNEQRLRAHCLTGMNVRILPPKPFLERNHDIVDACILLVAAPKESCEPTPGRGQGTWSTVRYARKRKVLINVVWPDGHVTEE
jgi:hypothetical protein